MSDFSLNQLIAPFLIATTTALIFGHLIIKLYLGRGWIDDPKSQTHKKVIHTYPVPRGGGLVVFFAILISAVFFLQLTTQIWGILIGALILALVGWLDDVYNLSPYSRLILGVLAAVIVVGSGVGIAYITNPLGEGVLNLNNPQLNFVINNHHFSLWFIADAFAIIWIVWSMNMMNWSKGLDGQLPGTVTIAAMVIAILSLRFNSDAGQWQVTILAIITAGAYLGLLYWNKFPQKMMPGYGAGSLAGYLLAVLSILSGAKLATLILVLGIPMIDALYVIARRVLNGQSPVWGDRRHFHHKLLDLGFSKTQIAYFYWGVTLLLGIISLYLNPKQKFYTILVIIFSFGGLLLWLRSLTNYSKPPGPDNG